MKLTPEEEANYLRKHNEKIIQEREKQLSGLCQKISDEYLEIGDTIKPEDCEETAKNLMLLAEDKGLSITKVFNLYFDRVRQKRGLKSKFKSQVGNLIKLGFGKKK
jgi:hypothetical protein